MLRSFGIIIIAMVMLCVMLLAGCGQGGGELSMDLQAPPTNLDPQFATGQTEQMLLANIMEGLVVKTPAGEIIPGCAESWEISPDGLVYTFRLRDGLFWADEDKTPLVAGDFVFGLMRLFSSPPSPHAADFAAIKGASQNIAGENRLLGIKAADKRTLIIELEYPDPMLLTRLSGVAAMPCSRAFFEACKGRYGLERDLVLSNGPFFLQEWNNEKQIVIAKNAAYHSAADTAASGVRFYIGRENPQEQFSSGKSQLLMLTQSELNQIKRSDIKLYPSNTIIWYLAVNAADEAWQHVILRQALALATNREAIAAVPVVGLEPTSLILPKSALLGEKSLAELAGIIPPSPYDSDEAARVFDLAMSMLELEAPPGLAIIAPDSAEHVQRLGALQRDWQRALGISPRIQRLPGESLGKRIAEGDFQAALLAFVPKGAQTADMLAAFVGENPANYTSPLYSGAVSRARGAVGIEDMARRYIAAQGILLADAAVIPLYEEQAYCAVAADIEGLWVYPLGGGLYFK